jgi:hypothetical protein
MVLPGLLTLRCSTLTLGESLTVLVILGQPLRALSIFVHEPVLTLVFRSLGQASAAANNWFWNFIISRFTPQMFLTMGYMFFASLMICSIVFVFFLLPETKTIPLEHMDRLFEIKPVRTANRAIMEEIQAQDAEFRHNAEGAGLTGEKVKAEQAESV